MRRILSPALVGLALVGTLVIVSAPRVATITYGFVDSANQFPNVGAFVIRSPANGRIFPICTGTLIAPDVFLTASHCTQYFERVAAPRGFTAHVSFDPSIPFGSLTIPATTLITVTQVVSNPLYNQRQSDPGDIAVLLVDPAETVGVVPAVLPTAGLLDDLAVRNGLKDTLYAVAGYGIQDRVVGGGTPYFEDANPVPRMYAVSSFNAINDAWLRLSQNPATGNGGACYGDSGGPNFLRVNGVRTLVAVTVTGDAVCRATNVVYRLDTEAARAFLAPYVVLP